MGDLTQPNLGPARLRDATAPQPEPPLAFDAFNEVVGLSETQDLEGRLASAR